MSFFDNQDTRWDRGTDILFYKSLSVDQIADFTLFLYTKCGDGLRKSSHGSHIEQVVYGYRSSNGTEKRTDYEYFRSSPSIENFRDSGEAFEFVSKLSDDLKASNYREIDPDHNLFYPDGRTNTIKVIRAPDADLSQEERKSR